MLISHESAMRIVTEMSSILKHDVNMMDEKGLIIASTDPHRIGTVHGGALALLESGGEELVIAGENEYPGAKPGINLPVVFEGATVGVIGITGRKEEIQQYSRIIKKMTEILLLESWGERQKQIRAAQWSHFMEQWLFSPSEVIDETFVERGMQLGIDIRQPRLVFIAALAGGRNDSGAGPEVLERVETAIHSLVRGESGGFYYKLPFKYVCFVPSGSPEKFRSLLQKAVKIVSAFGVRLFIGADAETDSPQFVRQAYDHADKALRTALQSGTPVVFYDDVDFELLISQIPLEARRSFIGRLFRSCTEAEQGEIVSFLRVYFSRGGSLQAAADALFLHKNTVQYKLRKITKLTRFDPRDPKNAAVFQAAIAIYTALSGHSASEVLQLRAQ